jgi:hypothetical protein
VETKISLSPDGLELLLYRVVAKKSEPVTGDLRIDGPVEFDAIKFEKNI